MASLKLVTGAVAEVTSGGVAVALAATSLPISSLSIQADPNNTGVVYFGDSTVTTSNGFGCLSANDSTEISVDSLFKTGETVVVAGTTYNGSDRWSDPGEVYVNAGVQYKANSTTNNKTGTSTVAADVSLIKKLVLKNG